MDLCLWASYASKRREAFELRRARGEGTSGRRSLRPKIGRETNLAEPCSILFQRYYLISNRFPIKWKKWFFLLALFFWKIKQFLLATDCSNCSKHCSKKTIPYDERKKQKTKKYFFIIFMILLFLIIEQFIIAIVLVPNIVPKG